MINSNIQNNLIHTLNTLYKFKRNFEQETLYKVEEYKQSLNLSASELPSPMILTQQDFLCQTKENLVPTPVNCFCGPVLKEFDINDSFLFPTIFPLILTSVSVST